MVCKYMSDDAVTIMIFMKKPTKKEIAQISENHHVKYAMVIYRNVMIMLFKFGIIVIADGAIKSGKIYTGAVTVSKITSNTPYKIDVGAVTADKIAANAVSADSIQPNAITFDKIKADAITFDKILAGVVNADKIVANANRTFSLSGIRNKAYQCK